MTAGHKINQDTAKAKESIEVKAIKYKWGCCIGA